MLLRIHVLLTTIVSVKTVLNRTYCFRLQSRKSKKFITVFSWTLFWEKKFLTSAMQYLYSTLPIHLALDGLISSSTQEAQELQSWEILHGEVFCWGLPNKILLNFNNSNTATQSSYVSTIKSCVNQSWAALWKILKWPQKNNRGYVGIGIARALQPMLLNTTSKWEGGLSLHVFTAGQQCPIVSSPIFWVGNFNSGVAPSYLEKWSECSMTWILNI